MILTGFYIYDDDDEPATDLYETRRAAEHAYWIALNSGDFTEGDGYYVAAGAEHDDGGYA